MTLQIEKIKSKCGESLEDLVNKRLKELSKQVRSVQWVYAHYETFVIILKEI